MATKTLFGRELVVVDETNYYDFFATFDINLDDLVQAVREIAAENPRYVYGSNFSQCNYQVKFCPACIIGRALVKIGVPVALLVYLDTGGDSEDTEFTSPWAGDTTVRALAGAGSVLLDYELDPRIEWLNFVQERQDSNIMWQSCINEADKKFPLSK